jgi:hypothetical protein
MKVLQYNASTLILHHQSGLGTRAFVLVWASLFMGVPLSILISLFLNMGVINLSCQRVSLDNIRCEKHETKVLALKPSSPRVFEQVTSAMVDAQEGQDSDGDWTMDYRVLFDTQTGKVTVVEGFMRINGVKGSAIEMQAFVDQINGFIQSSQTTLQIRQNQPANAFHFLLPLAFLSVFEIIGAIVLYSIFCSELFIFDKRSGRLIREKKTLRGKRSQLYWLKDITGVEIISKTDSDNDTYYELKLLPHFIHPTMLMSSRNFPEIETSRATIQQFLNLD